uniref:Uncharacterized protein n=1 Tax=Anguilla anguilla TaxID=7936 RepID=A0A0E9SY22_ANGAN
MGSVEELGDFQHGTLIGCHLSKSQLEVLPGHVVEAESLGIFKTRLDKVLVYYLVCR